MPDSDDADRPNVLFLLSDQHGPREVGGHVETPTLDGLYDSGTAFEQTYCQYPLCTPSRMCLLTGREAQRCGAYENWMRVPPGVPTLPGTFSEAGYETCLVGKMHLGGDRQFVGFDHRPYGDLTGGTGHQSDPPASYWQRDAAGLHGEPGVTAIPESLLQEHNTAREATAWLREHEHASDDPWFLCASFSRPHAPHTAPARHFERYWPGDVPDPVDGYDAEAPHRSMDLDDPDGEAELRRNRAAYLACVDYLDEVLGDFLRDLEADGLLENTVVVYASDHGEIGGRFGQFGKVRYVEDSQRVPFVFETPAQRRGDAGSHRVETPVSLGDLFPTLCDLCGVDAPEGLDGESLAAAVETGAEPDRGPVVCDNLTDSFGNEEYRSVREGRYKYVHFPDSEDLLFDLEADPHEHENLAPDAAGEDREALERLRSIVAETIDFDAVRAARRAAEEELTDQFLGLPTSKGLENCYVLPDGRLVNGDAVLYPPDTVAETPENVYDDWPEGS